MAWKSSSSTSGRPPRHGRCTPTRRRYRRARRASPRTIVRRSAQRGPEPLQNVVSSTGSWYQGRRTIVEVGRAGPPRRRRARRGRRRRRRRWPRPAGTGRWRRGATGPTRSTSPRWTRRSDRNTRPRAGTSTNSTGTGPWSHGIPRGSVSSPHRGAPKPRASVPPWRRRTRGTGVGSARTPGAARGAPSLVVHRRVGRHGGRGRRARGRPRRPVQRQLPHPGRAVAAGARPARAATSRAAPATTHSWCSSPTPGITSSSVEPAISESVAALEKIPNVTSVTDPYGPLGSAFISKNGQIARGDGAVRHPGAEPAQGRLRPDPGRRPRRQRRPACKLAYGGAVDRLRRPAAAGQRRPHRSARRGRDPAVRVRLGRRDGPADPHRAVRPRHRHLDRARGRVVHRDRIGRARARHDDRPRRRHRLLAVHRHALPREPRHGHGRSRLRSGVRSPPPAPRCCSRARRS